MYSLKPLVYFSIFNYPLSSREIYLFSSAESEEVIKQELCYLKEKGVVTHDDQYYTIHNHKESVSKRKAGNKMANNMMQKAYKRGVFIAKFPYIKAVGISGALSKNYHDKDSDVDYFVITKANRLWIARTLLMLYKKVFLLNSRKLFCVNYFITEETLEIKEQNIFTATELLTMIPVCGNFDQFYKENQWVSGFLPNLKIGKKAKYETIKTSVLTRIVEYFFSMKLGNSVERWFLKITLQKWNSKFNHLSKQDFNIALKSKKGVSKHHPRNFQKKVIDKLNKKYAEFQLKHNIILEEEHA